MDNSNKVLQSFVFDFLRCPREELLALFYNDGRSFRLSEIAALRSTLSNVNLKEALYFYPSMLLANIAGDVKKAVNCSTTTYILNKVGYAKYFNYDIESFSRRFPYINVSAVPQKTRGVLKFVDMYCETNTKTARGLMDGAFIASMIYLMSKTVFNVCQENGLFADLPCKAIKKVCFDFACEDSHDEREYLLSAGAFSGNYYFIQNKSFLDARLDAENYNKTEYCRQNNPEMYGNTCIPRLPDSLKALKESLTKVIGSR